MLKLGVSEAELQFSRLIEAIETGREVEVIIARSGRPIARLVAPTVHAHRLGVAHGKFKSPAAIVDDNATIAKSFADGES